MQSDTQDKENITASTSSDQAQSVGQPLKESQNQRAGAGDALDNNLMWIGNHKSSDLKSNFERFKKQKVEQIKYRKYVTE